MTNILVIDDDPGITNMLDMLLSSDTYRVHTANSGRVGMRLLRENTFDVVITDIIMPEFDGFEVIIAINGMQPRPRVIVMTGGSIFLSREYLVDVANALNVQKVLQKPFSIDELLKSVSLHEGCVAAAG